MTGDRRDIPGSLKMLATTPIFHPLQLMSSSRALIGLNLLTLRDDRSTLDEYIEPLREWAEAGVSGPSSRRPSAWSAAPTRIATCRRGAKPARSCSPSESRP